MQVRIFKKLEHLLSKIQIKIDRGQFRGYFFDHIYVDGFVDNFGDKPDNLTILFCPNHHHQRK